MTEREIIRDNLMRYGNTAYLHEMVDRSGLASVLDDLISELRVQAGREPLKRTMLLECKYDLIRVMNRLEDN